jgi:hypothetical protein
MDGGRMALERWVDSGLKEIGDLGEMGGITEMGWL